ncbi:MAG: thiamine biosynthesis protein ThiS [Stygiobacter sp. RIFOXYC12_FULL_38_8]|nr:MAG: thiamine biosynthesis protein ThiS [Stygiobacter sp. GWC2_38_9]OGU80522.1 MAG: thiamine biosynthesis protein ThiS [Stygiobacter sp. RIFOXYA12_FULL_38_9]OGV08438.1 MAG: thiamine biosynthesis protein ThiS [Stygiobacter sp. RIFOXYB2_FULL_37_11]OGV12018.1 MAG: thiamine biosynthesis protein ThiS [Stygiobacter sp. RIFOXYA2_FULL_38_8]OGV14395.1 MAG: thiamine biosynthesis protein ThiS [Stygiobacter sp. RIFOXYC2_FULL_38_25]OGV25518.1 MAG: thiamine biosynthesis protein ThiS [Stygiobacter sp. RIF
MKITLNNNIEVIETSEDRLTINQLLQIKKYSFKNLVVKINGELVKRDSYDQAKFKEGDKVDVIHMISGG